GALVRRPLGGGRPTGRIRRGQPLPNTSRLQETAHIGPPNEDERLYRAVDAHEQVAADVDKIVAQVAENTLTARPRTATLLIRARTETQLRENLAAVGWSLSAAQMKKLDEASAVTLPYPYYPYWNGQFAERNPPVGK